MGKTDIEWATYVWNPVTGCTKTSPACEHCYAERMARRLAGRYGYPEAPHHFDVTLHRDKLDDPLRWRKPGRVFVVSMGDLFHEDVKMAWHVMAFNRMLQAPQHTYLFLTKRPEKALHVFRAWYESEGTDPPPNWWVGVTAENQEQADKRIPVLLEIPAAVRFVSVEPMLGPVDLMRYLPHNFKPGDATYGWEYQCSATAPDGLRQCGYPPEMHPRPAISWVICGAETGPGRRLMKTIWPYGLLDQCRAAGIPFFFKKGNLMETTLGGVEYHEFPR